MDDLGTIQEWIIVFFALIAVDFAWARYTQAIKRGMPMMSSVYAMAILGLGAFGIISYTSNHWLLIPACAGAFVGTYVAVRFA